MRALGAGARLRRRLRGLPVPRLPGNAGGGAVSRDPTPEAPLWAFLVLVGLALALAAGIAAFALWGRPVMLP